MAQFDQESLSLAVASGEYLKMYLDIWMQGSSGNEPVQCFLAVSIFDSLQVSVACKF